MTFKNLFSGENGKKLLIIGAAAVMILLLLSSVFGGRSSGKVSEKKAVSFEDAAELEQALEARVKRLVESIDGAGTANVMVTLDRTSTLLYEKNEKSQTDARGESGGGSQNAARETETVLAGSSKEPLQTGVVLPKVRGAAVVCGGAEDPLVREKVTNAVAKALNIGISRVYVTY